jgi:ribosome-associated protein
MKIQDIIDRDLLSEVKFSFSRSGGAGGQNVNKVNTKAELRFNINLSLKLTPEEKAMLLNSPHSSISKDGDLIIVSQESRSQLDNRELCIAKFIKLIVRCTTKQPKRIKTKRSLNSIKERLFEKTKRSIIKSNRKDVDNGFSDD